MAKLIIEDGGYKIDCNYIGPLSSMREKLQGLTFTEVVVIGGIDPTDLEFVLSLTRPTKERKVLVRAWTYVDLSKYRQIDVFPNPHDLS